jgi:hypothetical protein
MNVGIGNEVPRFHFRENINQIFVTLWVLPVFRLFSYKIIFSSESSSLLRSLFASTREETAQRLKTIENWPNTAYCPALLEESGPAVVICTCDGRFIPSSLAGCIAWPNRGC